MGAAALPVIMFTLIWGGVGIVAPYFVKAGPNKRLIQTCLALTAACCWLFWLCCYMSQMNPLIGGYWPTFPYRDHIPFFSRSCARFTSQNSYARSLGLSTRVNNLAGFD